MTVRELINRLKEIPEDMKELTIVSATSSNTDEIFYITKGCYICFDANGDKCIKLI